MSVSSVRVSFRTDHARMPEWADVLRCWTCAGAELDRLVTGTAVAPSEGPTP